MKKKLFIKLILAFLIWSTPFVLAGSNSIPTANEVRSWMISLSDPDISGLEKQQLTARIYYNLDIYRAAAMNDPKAFRPNDNIVKKFQKYRSQMILDVIEKTNLKYRSKYGFNIRGPVIPFSYNNIFSDDDIILSSKHEGRVLEGLFNESLDEVMQKRANISFGKLDRTRIDINGLSWDMSVKAGATRNFFHPEKYINAESGFANQRKLMSGKLFVAEFDTTGRLRAASTKVARDKLLALETDKPLKIKGLPVDIGTASMMDYQRMATMHRIKNFDLPQGATGRIKSTYFSQKTAQFIRNQKYTERLVGDIEDLSAKLKENGSITRTPPEIKKWSVDIGYAKRIRKCLSIGQLSSVLQERYQGLKILNNGIVNFEELKKAMVDFQNLQLKMMNEMVAVGQKLEAPKMLEWIREGGITNKQKMRQRLALRYAPYDDKEIRKILRSLEDSGMNSKDYAFFESVLTDDVKKVRKYANEVRKAMGTDGGFEALQNKKTFTGLFANWMEPSNPRDMLMTELEMRSPHLSEFKQKMFSSPSGKSLYRFSKTKLGKALNIDTILDDSKAGKSTMAIMMTLSFYRAYQSGGTQKGMKAVGLAAFEMIPLVSGVLRISEGEYKNAIKEFVCDFVPPVALARLAFAGLGYAGQTAKADFTERLWEAQALEALENILDDDDFEQTDMGYYRFKDRNNVLELMHEIAPGFGGPWAKLSSLVLPQIEALMSKNKEVETNLAAMETIFYLDPALYLDPATSDIKRFTQKIRKEGIPPQGKTSATVRTLAKLIMRNEEIRAKLRVVVMNQFLNRIEKFYNRKIGNQDDAPEASKVKERKTWAIALLKKDNRKAKKHLNKYLHRKIDSALNDHIKMVKAIDSTAKHGFLEKFTVWLNSFDPETFRNEKIHQYDLKITPNERIDLEQLLMRVIESYRAYIKKLQKMSNWNKDTNSISLKTYI
ncbi:MAG TPA: hypothetical protein ENK75_04030, partial [Saprospiraceae bacterium]|nr:hypothetical protein [Saprospiraceae bacterium]